MNSYSPSQAEDLIQGIVGCSMMLGFLALTIFTCVYLFKCLDRIPAEFRLMEPGLVWLMLVPCLNIVWMFFVFTRVPQSFKAFFESVGDDSVGDCGFQIGLLHCIANVVGCGCPVGLILLIVFLVRMSELKRRMDEYTEEDALVDS